MNGEIHLFIIWSKGMYRAEEIIKQINFRFHILDIYLVNWSSKFFSDNISRFYGTNLPDGSHKEQHCGRGNFCLVIVRDDSPVYDYCQTTAGRQHVNTNMFHAKQHFRSMTGGGHRIHGTNSPMETAHDLMLLMEKDVHAYTSEPALKWDGEVRPLKRDLPGASGWDSIEQLFRVLNATTPYLVLRNFEGLPQKLNLAGHDDIDLLCDDINNMRYLSNAKPLCNEPYRVLHTIEINGRQVLFDFRHTGDNYYDTQWQRDMIANRQLSKNCFYRPSDKDHFYSLLYHAAIHKPEIKSDYIEKLCLLSKGYEDLTPEDFAGPHKIKSVLDQFLKSKGYRYTEPVDLSVHFNSTISGTKTESLDRILGSSPTLATALNRLLSQSNSHSNNSPEYSKKIYQTHPLLKRHFSSRRYAFINAIPFNNVKRVLEINAESGLLTRYLGERFEDVVSVEKNAEFRECIETRCRDLTSVKVIADVHILGNDQTPYDLIILTADCRSWFFDEMTMAKATGILQDTISLLAPDGIIIFSVDNPLSTKGVFASATALNASGQGYDDALKSLHVDDVVQFFNSEGLVNTEVFFMFPDHMLPKTIFSAEAERRRLRAFGYWAGTAGGMYANSHRELISAGEMAKAGFLGSLAGGICIMAARNSDDLPAVSWQVLSHGSSARSGETSTKTIVKTGGDLMTVKEGRSIFNNPVFAFEPNQTYPLTEGCLADAVLINSVISGSMKRVIDVFQQVVDFWVTSYRFEYINESLPNLTVPGDIDLSGDALDAIPRNLMIANGDIKFFDNEWKSLIPLPLSYLVFRSLISLTAVMEIEKIIKNLVPNGVSEINTFNKLIVFIINQLNRFEPIGLKQVSLFFQFEQRFQEFAHTGKLSDTKPSLLELYQMVKAYSGVGEHAKKNMVLGQLNKSYQGYKEVQNLVNSCFSSNKNNTIDAGILNQNALETINDSARV